MTIDPNDPRVTAYVLGELDPPERAVVEAMLLESPECLQAVEEIRQTASWLTERLHEESQTHSPSVDVKHPTVANGLYVAPHPKRSWWQRNGFRALGLAAVLMLGATISLVRIAPKAPVAADNA